MRFKIFSIDRIVKRKKSKI